jgi:hypothetical protein
MTQLPPGYGIVIRALPEATEDVDVSMSLQRFVDQVTSQPAESSK